MRKAEIKRKTFETDIELELVLDGRGTFEGKTPSGFFDHLLSSFFKYAGFDVRLSASGDVEVDLHHTVEDVGIVLGMAFRKAISDKKGIRRFAHAIVPMDEALVLAAIDISGRGGFFLKGGFPGIYVGTFPVELAEEFFIAFCREAGVTLHIDIMAGKNAHHTLEAAFKAVGMALGEAVKIVSDDIPSTKGVL